MQADKKNEVIQEFKIAIFGGANWLNYSIEERGVVQTAMRCNQEFAERAERFFLKLQELGLLKDE